MLPKLISNASLSKMLALEKEMANRYQISNFKYLGR